jgi:hypothetical protein
MALAAALPQVGGAVRAPVLDISMADMVTNEASSVGGWRCLRPAERGQKILGLAKRSKLCFLGGLRRSFASEPG